VQDFPKICDTWTLSCEIW